MPEGDTIHRTAAALRAALLGKPMTAFEAPRLRGLVPTPGAVVERVESHGKHLEIGWDDGVVLHTHMRMSGSWHLYRPGERWRKSHGAMRVVIEVPGFQAVCFSAPVVETYRARNFSHHPGGGALGPDLAKADADLAECVERMGRYCEAETTVAEALLDQRVACGVGNVYKSEVLWVCELHPFTPVGALDGDQRRELLGAAAMLLRANLHHGGRVTVPGSPEGVAVYGRFGKPCLRCGTPIEVRKHGEQARVTYWCPSCQVFLPLPEPEVVDDEAPVSKRRFGRRRGRAALGADPAHHADPIGGDDRDDGDDTDDGGEVLGDHLHRSLAPGHGPDTARDVPTLADLDLDDKELDDKELDDKELDDLERRAVLDHDPSPVPVPAKHDAHPAAQRFHAGRRDRLEPTYVDPLLAPRPRF